MARRRTSADGFKNKVEVWALTHLGPLWWVAQRTPLVGPFANRVVINKGVNRSRPRPYALSTKSDYTSWASLTEKEYNARQLPPSNWTPRGTVDEVRGLFARDETILCPKSTVLFAYLAQWFTDGFLRSRRPDKKKNEDMRDIRQTECKHEVDLGQLYGLDPVITDALRSKVGGQLKYELVGEEMFPPKLYHPNGDMREEFKDKLPPVVGIEDMPERVQALLKPHLYAMGSDVANTQIGYAMLNILFLREHNRIARELATQYRDCEGWDDDRLFETARNILTVKLVKLVIEEYINHIAPYRFKFKFDPPRLYGAKWYRPNWIAVEFNLLYRWHSLIPSTLEVGGQELTIDKSSFNNELIEQRGLGAMFDDASKQPAGKICLFNTDRWFDEWRRFPTGGPPVRRTQSVEQARAVKLDTYNAYRKDCGFPPRKRFDEISSDPKVKFELERIYGHPDNVEFYVGLFAEDTRPNSVLPPLMGAMVGLHAFSQLLTNPLLSKNVYRRKGDRERTFSKVGARMIKEEATLQALLDANVPKGQGPYAARLTRADWRRETIFRRARAATPGDASWEGGAG
jgi:prostaglandin-endoperoxide synthase 2